ncbi:hypothetical protein JCM15519_01370 [Fundidesulfovibrio butyratiphilus]
MTSWQPDVTSLLSGEDALELLELIQDCLYCTRREQFYGLFEKLKKSVPFDYAICGTANLDDVGSMISYTVENISYPLEWLQVYYDKNFVETDVVINKNFTSFTPQYWSDTYRAFPPSGDYIKISGDFGLQHGYTHGSSPFGQWKHASLFSFASPHMKKRDLRTLSILSKIVPHFHYAISNYQVASTQQEAAKKITPREKEILRWLKEGKSSWEISVILKISERTVNFHVYNIMRKLDVVNRPQAVATALHLGLVVL